MSAVAAVDRAAAREPAVRVRALAPGDLAAVVRLDAHHTGKRKPKYWQEVFAGFLARGERTGKVGLAAEAAGELVGYLLGEVRAFEFGSEPCGWLFAVGVAPERQRGAIASQLLAEACRRFRAAGVACVRTMVRKSDVPVMAFFRANRFVGGSFVQLELDLAEARDER